MTRDLKLSKRLQTIASQITEGSYFADIGSDHAYLPCYICLQDDHARAIAGEVIEGPFLRATETVEHYNLSDRVHVRLGDGLEVIGDDNVDEIVIAGMGGSLIKAILEAGINKLTSVNRIIVQPNTNAAVVREFFLSYQFSLIHEEILEEKDHIYEVLVAERNSTFHAYDESIQIEKQLMFGPLLMQEKSHIFIKKWLDEKNNLIRIIAQMNEAKGINETKIALFKQQLRWIEEVLV